MRAPEVKEVIKDSIDHPHDFPAIFLWGGPGIGKSSVCKQAAIDKGVDFIDIRALLLDPTDLRGIPIPEDGKAKWLAPSFLPTEGRGLIMFDELVLAPPIVSNSILQLVLDRMIGEYVLPDGWCIVAASNRETEAIGVYRLSPPLANRFVHVSFDILDESGHSFVSDAGICNPDWITWAVKNDVHPAVMGLLSKFRPELIYKFDANHKAFPTPRSWEFVSKIMKNSASRKLKFELIKGCVGEGAARELAGYMELWDKLPDLDAILDGKDIIPDSIDVTYATIVGLVSRASKPKDYNRLLDYALELQRDFGVYFIKLLFAKDEQKTWNAPNWKKVSDILVVEEKIITA